MTDYTKQTNISLIYKSTAIGGSEWDNGDSVWDVVGNVNTSIWDGVSKTSYTATTENTPIWTEQ